MNPIDNFRGALLGLACGDAVGTTVEFKPRGSFMPLTDMVGGGPFNLQRGQWTDDTSMAMCLAESLLRCDDFDARDQMNRYANWYRHGYWSATGECFDIGMATRSALDQFLLTGQPLAGNDDPRSAGNGSIMRLAPVVLRYAGLPELPAMAELSSRTTHAARECLDACRLFAVALQRALAGASKAQVLDLRDVAVESERLRDIAAGGYRPRSRGQIRGSGYVVDSLEAALWCFAQHDDFAAVVLEAANLGDDADTTAAVAGQLAGAFHGMAGIPPQWLQWLALRAQIQALADGLFQRNVVAHAATV
ncbi:ADP-ribosylglycohydrolase family protein [Stenotrophomonas sp. S48]|uniref:ADP-ribosylglycohydrolase family protein n=1 Tax=unclassified Stenotrophomonas TaxID=196198 RepID=UPI0018FFC03A|nr:MULTISPECIES: ADP-ribosylglycohydrolase family protein [unclassified Stenotrophomonas]MBK0027508.1 ADP-ribosylglycohydrolase family protein [Stenotrophomonas sp. S48]MBK0049666.1 ADP-ribosylglycohydrolase family protein [Stenotrophomonas sp. S49]